MSNPGSSTTGDADRTLVDNAEANRWELRFGDDLVGVVEYRIQPDGSGSQRDIMHVEVASDLRGKGVSAPFLDEVLVHERLAGRKVTPYCGYAAAHIRRHPEHHDLLA